MAQATDIALDTIRAIENNRRTLTPKLLEKIRDSIGAQWDPKRQLWHLAYAADVPYLAEIYRKFRTGWFKHPQQIRIETQADLLELLGPPTRKEGEDA